jgi:hypothetical protein
MSGTEWILKSWRTAEDRVYGGARLCRAILAERLWIGYEGRFPWGGRRPGDSVPIHGPEARPTGVG